MSKVWSLFQVSLCGACMIASFTIAQARSRCVELFGRASIPSSSLYRPDKGTLFETLRANPPHYWAWARENARVYFSEAELTEGAVIGDPHILNFGFSFIGKRYRYAVQDLDDVGPGPLLLDITRFITGAKLMTKNIKVKELISAYREGLAGKKSVEPKTLEKVLAEYPEKPEFDHDAFEELPLLKETSASVRKLYDSTAKAFLAELGVKDVMEVRVRLKNGGGSQGMVRFWLKFRQAGTEKIYEFKQLAESAPLQWSGDLTLSRAQAVEKGGFRPKNDDENIIVATPRGDFLARPRLDYPGVVRKIMEKKPDSPEAQELLLYIANFMGLSQGQQSGGKKLAQLWENDAEALAEKLKVFMHAYSDVLEELHESRPGR